MRRLLSALSLGLVAGALGCLGGSSKAPEFFTLSRRPPRAQPSRRAPSVGIVVGPIEIPRYLDRSEVVTRDGANRLDVWDEHRWAGSLRTDMLRVMSDDLGTLLGTTRVAVYPVEPSLPGRATACSSTCSSSRA